MVSVKGFLKGDYCNKKIHRHGFQASGKQNEKVGLPEACLIDIGMRKHLRPVSFAYRMANRVAYRKAYRVVNWEPIRVIESKMKWSQKSIRLIWGGIPLIFVAGVRPTYQRYPGRA